MRIRVPDVNAPPHFQMPPICANCADDPADENWTVREVYIGPHPLMFFTIFFGVAIIQNRRMEFEVAICEECQAILKRNEQLAGLSRVLIVVATALLALVTASQDQSRIYILPIIILVAGILLLFYVPTLINPPLGSYARGIFHFRNTEYQGAFAERNPYLVDRVSRSRYASRQDSFWD